MSLLMRGLCWTTYEIAFIDIHDTYVTLKLTISVPFISGPTVSGHTILSLTIKLKGPTTQVRNISGPKYWDLPCRALHFRALSFRELPFRVLPIWAYYFEPYNFESYHFARRNNVYTIHTYANLLYIKGFFSRRLSRRKNKIQPIWRHKL